MLAVSPSPPPQVFNKVFSFALRFGLIFAKILFLFFTRTLFSSFFLFGSVFCSYSVGSVMAQCNQCNRCIFNVNHNSIQCKFCKSMYHKRCVYGNLDDDNWFCSKCSGDIFPFNHVLDDGEFLFSIHYFKNSLDYNKLLDLKFNPFLFEVGINDTLHDHLQNHGISNSCNYIFDPSSDFNLSFKSGFSMLHFNVRSFNKNHDLINAFISNLNFTFSIIALSETWFNEDHSNPNDILLFD